MRTLSDKFNRVHDYLRISLTDKCNLNCRYCNPVHSHIKKLKRSEILTFDELLRLIEIFTGKLGVKKIRFTGGEPLVRKDILKFFNMLHPLKQQYGFETGLTTNGTLLEDKLSDLKKSGLDRLNISLDTLKPDRFTFITGKDNFHSVKRSIFKASELGFDPLKINMVVMKNLNDDELIDFVDFVNDTTMNVRFIEYMPFGSNQWKHDGFISSDEIRSIIETKYQLISLPNGQHHVSEDFGIAGHSGKVSFISSISRPFCSTCNRLRIDAKGKMKLCLFSNGENELNFKELLNIGSYSDDDICDFIDNTMQFKRMAHPEVAELMNVDNNMWSIGG
jgi:molybdenum cofactor biosynthesis protein A